MTVEKSTADACLTYTNRLSSSRRDKRGSYCLTRMTSLSQRFVSGSSIVCCIDMGFYDVYSMLSRHLHHNSESSYRDSGITHWSENLAQDWKILSLCPSHAERRPLWEWPPHIIPRFYNSCQSSEVPLNMAANCMNRIIKRDSVRKKSLKWSAVELKIPATSLSHCIT